MYALHHHNILTKPTLHSSFYCNTKRHAEEVSLCPGLYKGATTKEMITGDQMAGRGHPWFDIKCRISQSVHYYYYATVQPVTADLTGGCHSILVRVRTT